MINSWLLLYPDTVYATLITNSVQGILDIVNHGAEDDIIGYYRVPLGNPDPSKLLIEMERDHEFSSKNKRRKI